jgi:hypothetical protein
MKPLSTLQMKQAVTIFLFFILLFTTANAQNQDSLILDSFLKASQTIELTISTPQPRINQNFTLSLDINHIRANIFQSLAGKIAAPIGVHMVDNSDFMIANVSPAKKGWEEIGPFVFTINKTTYTTNKIKYEVVDALPSTDKGIWIRKVELKKNEFCIIIEQRIPSTEVTTKTENTINITNQPEASELMRFKYTYSISGLSEHNSSSSSDFSSVHINGQDKQFMYGYSIYYFTIDNPKAKIKITEDYLENIPSWYHFPDIIVQ